jgi:AcrR family transcriptional regulator
MGYRHTRAQILDGALDAVFADGLNQLTFGRLAKRLAISDRTIVYYFPTKDDLVTAVLLEVGSHLQTTLAPVFATSVPDHIEMLRRAWPIVATSHADPVFALFFEASGLAAAGCEPYRSLVPRLVEGWIDWAAEFIVGTPSHRRTEAAATIALIDGLLLLRQLAGADVAERAAAGLGIARRGRRRQVGTDAT